MNEIKYVVHILQPVSETTIGGADMHVLDLVSLQKERSDIKPIVCIRWNSELKKRFESIGVLCFCGDKFSSTVQYIYWIKKQLKDIKVSLFHSHGYDANFQYLALRTISYRKVSSAKFIITSHGWIENTLHLKIKTWLDFFCHMWADSHIVCAQKNLLRLKGNSPRYCVHNGIIPFHCEKITSKVTTIGFVGRLSKEKRPDIVIEVANHFINNELVRFEIYGEGSELESITKLITSYGLTDKVFIKGQNTNRSQIFSNIDILILTSDTESTPRVVIEALSCGIPVVATNVGDVSQIVLDNENGFIANKGDANALANCISKLLAEPLLCKQMGANGRERVNRNFSATNMEEQIYEIYKKII